MLNRLVTYNNISQVEINIIDMKKEDINFIIDLQQQHTNHRILTVLSKIYSLIY